MKLIFSSMSPLKFWGMSFIFFMASAHISDAKAQTCDWNNPKEVAENGRFDGESENWQDIVRKNRYALFDIYENYQTPSAYPVGTRHLIGMDFAGDDLELLTERYEAATAYAKSVCDRELHGLIVFKYVRLLNDYSVLLDFLNNWPEQLTSDSYKAKIELLAKYKTAVQSLNNDPLILKNVSEKPFPNRLTIEARANKKKSKLIFDTGGGATTYGQKFGKKAKFYISEFENTVKTSGSRNFKPKLGFIDTLSIGSISLENVHVNLTPFKPNEFWRRGNKTENFDGLLGFDEIRKLGDRISFAVKNDRVDHIIIENYSSGGTIIDENNDIESKTLRWGYTNLPYVNLKIEDQSYACLWDTGWDVTTLSKAMYDKHSAVITPKVPASDAISGRLDQAVVAGKILPHDINFILPHDINFDQSKQESWCVIGLNAIIAAGGATWDVKNGRIAFGPRQPK